MKTLRMLNVGKSVLAEKAEDASLIKHVESEQGTSYSSTPPACCVEMRAEMRSSERHSLSTVHSILDSKWLAPMFVHHV